MPLNNPFPLKPLVIRDEIHNDISFDPLVRHIIDNPDFQRLRYIKQLGLADYVFPCATHTRFQHSLGCGFLASQYFNSLVQKWLIEDWNFKVINSKTKVYVSKTRQLIEQICQTPDSLRYWNHIITLAGLLHDIGHGPWSHTFEHLPLTYDFSAIIQEMHPLLQKTLKTKKIFSHEDISLIYIHQIFKTLARRKIIEKTELFSLPVSFLIHPELKKLLGNAKILALIEKTLYPKAGLMLQLLSPLISGPFDVDRIDYIQRDGKNCGVNVGAIEWRRIINKVLPCLCEHTSKYNETPYVLLITNIKNQHVLDDFIFSLFQMYTQVYLHPTIVGLEKMIKKNLHDCEKLKKNFVVTYDTHRQLTDRRLTDILVKKYSLEIIKDLFMRSRRVKFDVIQELPSSKISNELKKMGYEKIDGMVDRPMMKDRLAVFMYSHAKTQEKRNGWLTPWQNTSPIAKHFYFINYKPDFWIKTNLKSTDSP